MLLIMCYFLIFLFSLMNLFFKSEQLLLFLLSLEFLMMNLLFYLFIYLISIWNDYYIFMCFMIIMVVESILGLNLLILMIRFQGNDYFFSFNMLMC
uniref:NADH dehydrogenase subunit 4L n=1 Tax=Nyctiophylax orbicularis TaxID=2904907 RepID=A0A9E8LP37_9NEOP|nr:NADH dehydrogenase subunit 4L [Nyctiophylax orbicularis]UZZ44206.1 NADH dehydrogenase subunit 4L [Nyctiophylax orbicularis]